MYRCQSVLLYERHVPFECISLINFFSLVLPQGWGFRAFSHMNFCPGGRGFAAFLCSAVGDFTSQKISWGDVNSWNSLMHYMKKSICESSRNCYPLLALRYLNTKDKPFSHMDGYMSCLIKSIVTNMECPSHTHEIIQWLDRMRREYSQISYLCLLWSTQHQSSL